MKINNGIRVPWVAIPSSWLTIMPKLPGRLGLTGCLVLIVSLVPRAQMRVVPLDEAQGHVALGLALRHLGNTGIFMMATAHPDD